MKLRRFVLPILAAVTLTTPVYAQSAETSETVDCTALEQVVALSRAALDEVALSDEVRGALKRRTDLLYAGATLRNFPNQVGADGVTHDLTDLIPAFTVFEQAVDAMFQAELELLAAYHAAEDPWAEASIALSEARLNKTCAG